MDGEIGRLAQLARALRSHRRGRWFKSSIVHNAANVGPSPAEAGYVPRRRGFESLSGHKYTILFVLYASISYNIRNSYILKDVLALEKVKGPKILLDLLKLLAFQVGAEASLNEISVRLGIDVKTAGRYLDLLEKTFIITRLGGFSRNLRSEVVTKAKYFFLDTGIRNGIISQFNSLENRNDLGQLWENFIMIERIKKKSYRRIYGQSYFWRIYEQREIDLIEERDGKLFPYEFKWSEKSEAVAPKEWQSAYPESEKFSVIHPGNYLHYSSLPCAQRQRGAGTAW